MLTMTRSVCCVSLFLKYSYGFAPHGVPWKKILMVTDVADIVDSESLYLVKSVPAGI